MLFNYTIGFSDGTTITKEQYLGDAYGGGSAAMGVGADVGVMITNPFKRVSPTSVDFNMKMTNRLPQAQILAARLDKATYRPGDEVRIEWNVQPYRRPLDG